MSIRAGEFLKALLFKYWHIKLLALVFALFLWFYVISKDRVTFQVQVPVVDVPKGFKVFPDTVLVGGKISSKFYSERIFRCFKAHLEWDGRGKYARVRLDIPIPSVFVEIDTVYPQRVEVKEVSPKGEKP